MWLRWMFHKWLAWRIWIPYSLFLCSPLCWFCQYSFLSITLFHCSRTIALEFTLHLNLLLHFFCWQNYTISSASPHSSTDGFAILLYSPWSWTAVQTISYLFRQPSQLSCWLCKLYHSLHCLGLSSSLYPVFSTGPRSLAAGFAILIMLCFMLDCCPGHIVSFLPALAVSCWLCSLYYALIFIALLNTSACYHGLLQTFPFPSLIPSHPLRLASCPDGTQAASLDIANVE